ncbi:unnamed protein product [Blepharisma stoltei]|uniref:Adenylate kinase n=1 Tax=Blepharisma stoltei TaxID=1481888 RepID=A0AAU9K1X1_9CILI|nr:unnamed protein product [Blepharisma stoltei]
MSRIFINNINSYVGRELFQEIRGDPEEESSNVFIATLDPNDNSPRPAGVKKILRRDKPRLFKKYLLECDLIIYDLHTGNLAEVEEKLKLFKTTKFEEAKTIVLISSALVWGNTPPKMAQVLTEEEKSKLIDPDDPEASIEKDKVTEKSIIEPQPSERSQIIEKGEGVAEGEELKVEEPKEPEFVTVQFEESDYLQRKPSQKYEQWKIIEDLVLNLGTKENVNIYIICSGILYGNGEKVFNYHFRSAWLENPRALPYIFPGDNYIPTIHIKDLAKVVKFVIETKPETKYIFGIDKTLEPLQKSIIQAISKGIGTGEIEPVEKFSEEYQEWYEELGINVWMKPSRLLIPEPEGEEEAVLPFTWNYIGGIAENIRRLNEEYNKMRGLKPIKVFITGPPAAGKSHYGALLAEHYNVPHIHISDLLKEIAGSETDIGRMIAESEGRVDDKLVAEAFKLKLKSGPCMNRGYILDGWPRTYEDAKNLFMREVISTEPVEDGERNVEAEEEEEGAHLAPKVYENETEIIPNNVIILRAGDDFLIDRVRKLPAGKVKGTHYSDEGMKRRLQFYREKNDSDKETPVQAFFSDLNTEIYECESNIEAMELLYNMRVYIEREGRPFNFLASIEELEWQRINLIEMREKEKMRKLIENEEQVKKLAEEEKRKKDDKARKLFEQLKGKDLNLKGVKEMPLRSYLMENVIPFLSEGLLQVCKIVPEDPVDYLAEFMFTQSNQLRKHN